MELTIDNSISLIELAQKGDKKALEELVKTNLGLVHVIANKYINKGHEIKDLDQIGAIGLIKAIKRFDASLGYKFSTYASSLISGEIRRFIRDNNPIHIPRKLVDLTSKVIFEYAIAQKKLGRKLTVEELAERTNLPVAKVNLALKANKNGMVESLDKVIYAESDTFITLADKVGSYTLEEDSILDNILLKEAFLKLEDSLKDVIFLKYFQGRTQKEIADEIGVSQAQVSRKEKRALNKLKNILEIKEHNTVTKDIKTNIPKAPKIITKVIETIDKESTQGLFIENFQEVKATF